MLRASFVLAALSALAGCESAPEDLLFLSGTLVGEDGPVAGETVPLQRAFSFCNLHVEEPPEAPFLPFAEATTDASGRYLFELYRFQTYADAAQFGTTCFQIQTTANDGTVNTIQFPGPMGDSELAALPRWSSHLALLGDRLEIAAAPSMPNAATAGRWVELTSTDGDLLWSGELEGAGTVALPAGVAEDVPATLRVEYRAEGEMARALTPMAAGSTSFRFVAAPQAIGYTAPPRVPVSRGARCRFDDLEVAGCALADGVMARAFLTGGDLNQATPRAEILWDTPSSVSTVLVRGLVFTGRTAQVELLFPGGRSQAIGTLANPLDGYGDATLEEVFAAFAGVPEAAAIGVRITAEPGEALWSAREVSAFP